MSFEKHKKLISVVVPVYNVEKYIKKCLDSIINQTYKDKIFSYKKGIRKAVLYFLGIKITKKLD